MAGENRTELAGAACFELVSGVVQLRPQGAMLEAMLRGWRAQQIARGLREDTIAPRERLVRRFAQLTNGYPWAWSPGHMDEWSLHLTADQSLPPHRAPLPDRHPSWPARSIALFQLATELPAAILARMLRIHIKVAVAWQQAAFGTG